MDRADGRAVSVLDVADCLRGNAWAGNDEVAYPRADPADFARLPIDTWETAKLAVGVRLEVEGDASSIEIDYTCATDNLGYRGPQAGVTFAVWRGDHKLADAPAVLGDGTVTLPLDGGGPYVIHVPEGMRPRINAVRPVGGELSPVSRGPRWIAYGDSITEGWVASEPGMAWPAIVARRHGLDVHNLGYAGAARGERASAEQLAALPVADVMTIFYGTNCWTRIPDSIDTLVAGFNAFISIVREGHPQTPLVIVSPIVRPDGEATKNRLGATLDDLRRAMEDATEALGDNKISLVRGGGIVTGDQLPDGVHPGDDAQWVMADVIGEAVVAALN